MKLSEQWLREWVNPNESGDALCQRLTMAGLEVDSYAPVASTFNQVVVAEILHAEKHPNADRLKVCQVTIGQDEPFTIVCGAPNARAGLKTALAMPGAILPNNLTIKRSTIRDIVSNGMLCSARELGIADETTGIIELPNDAPLGQDIRTYLNLDDKIIDVAVTPNRGDCLSVLGLAKEVTALTQCDLNMPKMGAVSPTIKDQLPLHIQIPKECPRYVGRVIRQVKADVLTPLWMQERLKRSGIRCISPIVDVMNYVMLELGQPMHAFDLQEIIDEIIVRRAKTDEILTLLDGQTITLNSDTMVIADRKKPLAIAGVMGGLDSGVTLLTKDIFLESAFFSTESIARTSRCYTLNSESSHRFERGVDPTLQTIAIERATQLLQDIVGGEAGPVIDIQFPDDLPLSKTIQLRKARIDKLLGIQVPLKEVESILTRLDFATEKTHEGWQVTVPPHRSDILLEVDLIEEVIRLYGYDKLPTHNTSALLHMNVNKESQLTIEKFSRALCDAGFHEVITYSFVDKKLQHLLDPNHKPKALKNPITADMSVMRTNIWPGLIQTLLYNHHRQQPRVRIFEIGSRFLPSSLETYEQQCVIGGLMSGAVYPLQWGIAPRTADFFDVKGDIENLLKLTKASGEFHFKQGSHPALHPGQTADIYRKDTFVGVMGTLHPSVLQSLELINPVLVFELLLDPLVENVLPHYQDISKFPQIRRDIAIFVDQTVPSQAIQDTIYEVGGELLRDVTVFDIYQGKESKNRKSIALALTLQHNSRTLVDEEVTDIVERIVVTLKQKFAAELRG